MRRREFIALLGTAAAWPLAAQAQQPGMRRIGVLVGSSSESDSFTLTGINAFKQGLRELGWAENRNLKIDVRFGAGDPARVQAYAAELVGAAPDLIAASTLPAVVALGRLTSTLPIVIVGGADPVASGLVASVAHPGGNITGFSAQEPATGGKWLDVLLEVAPHVKRVMIVQNLENPNLKLYLPSIADAARGHGVQLTMPDLADRADLAAIFADFAAAPDGGVILIPGPFGTANRVEIITLATRYRLPSVYPTRNFVDDGGLISYGDDPIDLWRRSASYVDRILRGGKPADLPIQLPSKFEMAINLKTAKALGLDVPPLLLARADAVVE
jgi:putative ABC transport system substrate-binding protein